MGKRAYDFLCDKGKGRTYLKQKEGPLMSYKRLRQDRVFMCDALHSKPGNVINGAMRNSVQSCEWACRYFMNGGDHVIAAPPKADISH